MVDLVKAREKAKKEKEKKSAELSEVKETLREIAEETPQVVEETKAPKIPEKEPVSPAPAVPSSEGELAAQAETPPTPAEVGETETANQVAQYLTFIVGDEIYGIEIENIDEIIVWHQFTEVPNVPNVIAGIMPLRGRIVTIVDARIRLGHPPSSPTDATRIIVIREAEELYGLLVDAVSNVISISEEKIEDTSTMVTAPPKEYLQGVYHRESDMIIILDIEKFLNIPV